MKITPKDVCVCSVFLTEEGRSGLWSLQYPRRVAWLETQGRHSADARKLQDLPGGHGCVVVKARTLEARAGNLSIHSVYMGQYVTRSCKRPPAGSEESGRSNGPIQMDTCKHEARDAGY